jgi:hypothetical protein
MKGIKLSLLFFVTSVPLLIIVPVHAAASQTPLEITEYVCMNTPGEEWMDGNVYHLRGQIHENVWVVNGTIWGINTASIDLDWNQKTGQVTIRGFADVARQGVNGGYTGVGAFRFYGGGPRPLIGNSAARGYGDLQGQFLRMDVVGESLPPDSTGEAYCDGHGEYFSTTFWSGYILTADD